MSKEPVNEARPDRPPTEEEERVAERVSKDVDLDKTSENYEEMAELGADIKGEGQIDPE